jgi:hypothetical protein
MLRAAPNRIWTNFALFAILSSPALYRPGPQQPRFKAASIRPGGDILSTKPQSSPGRFVWTTDLPYLIGYAYGLESNRVSGKRLEVTYTNFPIDTAMEIGTRSAFWELDGTQISYKILAKLSASSYDSV